MWNTAIHLAHGGAFFGNTYPANGFYDFMKLGTPRQMPLFYYILAFHAKYTNMRVARFNLFLIYATFVLLISKRARGIQHEFTIALLLYAYPAFNTINFYGLFDVAPVLCVLLAVLLFKEDRISSSGVLIAMGILLKLYPIIVGYYLGLFLLSERRFFDAMKFFIFSLGPVFLWYGIWIYQFSFPIVYNYTLGWQFNRDWGSLSLLGLLPIHHQYYLYIEICVFSILPPLFIILRKQDENIWITLFLIMLSVNLSMNVLFSHYLAWSGTLLFPAITERQNQENKLNSNFLLKFFISYIIPVALFLLIHFLYGPRGIFGFRAFSLIFAPLGLGITNISALVILLYQRYWKNQPEFSNFG